MKLSSYTRDRDNNFNLMRLLAAFAVLVGHSFTLQWSLDPIEKLRLDMTMGSIAVDFFFIISGFLVSASLLARKNAAAFIWARFLRIYPALIVMVLFCIFGVGLHFTVLPTDKFLHHPRTLSYALYNMTLVNNVQFDLPGVFVNFETAVSNIVNQPIWTLFYEVYFYAALVCIWLVLALFKDHRESFFKKLLIIIAVTAFFVRLINYFYFHWNPVFFRLFFMFFSGAAYFVLQDKITLSAKWAVIAVIAILLSAVHNQLFLTVYSAVIAYIVFWLAYVPAGFIRKFNQAGDYSYGLYIYAFPVQQGVYATYPDISVLGLIIVSTAITFVLAFLSWHLIEKRALGLKIR